MEPDYIKSKNPKRIQGLSAVGASSPEELLLLVPKGYEDFRVNKVSEGRRFCGQVKVLFGPTKHPIKPMWTFGVETYGEELKITVFGVNPAKTDLWGGLRIGTFLHVRGVVQQFGRSVYLVQAIPVPDELVGTIAPVYKSIPRIFTSDRQRSLIHGLMKDYAALSCALDLLHQRLDAASPGQEALRSLLRSLHTPETIEEGEAALIEVRRLSVLAIAKQSELRRSPDQRSVIEVPASLLSSLKKNIPFSLSESQDDAIRGIASCLASNVPMSALLSGDVGTGKTIVYGLVAAGAWHVKANVGILVPNTPLAAQIVNELREFFPDVPVTLVASGNQEISGHSILVGTTALIWNAKRQGWKADFLIIDEQQKFGLEQKQALTHDASNVLESTATCIPHTLGMIKHGGMEIFRLKAHRQKDILTKVIDTRYRNEMMGEINRRIVAGDRVVIIYPEVKNSDSDDVDFRKNVIAAAEKWEEIYPGKVVVLHGRLTDTEKMQALEMAKSGEHPIIVSTSIVEVGLTVPKLRMALVVNADRYGVSTLHQMRGRLARDGGDGSFFPYLEYNTSPGSITDGQSETLERLRLLEQTNDGFKLAEMDAERRGYGDILDGEDEQHGKTKTVFLGLKLESEDFRLINEEEIERPLLMQETQDMFQNRCR